LIARFIGEQRAAGRGVESICAVLRQQGVQVAPRTYRSWRTNPVPARAVSDAAITDRLRGLCTGGADGGPLPETLYGRRKMTGWLAGNGFPGVSKHTVDRLMRTEGMRGLVRGRKTRTTIPGIAAKDGVRAGDLLNRNFRTSAPNRAWVTDFTYLSTWSGFAYVAFALDLYSRAIVGWSAAMRKDVAFVEQCLSMALWRRDHAGRPIPEGMIHHSDAGSQGGFNRSSQHLDLGGVDGQADSVDESAYWTGADEVPGGAAASAGSGARVLA
jgi:putative transposase